MSRADLSLRACTIARAVALVGDQWTFMILREMFLGTRRFDDFMRLTGISPHLLSQRLKKLEANGLIRREAYLQQPLRHEYRLTPMGRDMWPAVIALKQWGDRWLGDGEVPVEVVHRSCGLTARPHLVCGQCGERMDARDAEPVLSEEFQSERNATRRSY